MDIIILPGVRNFSGAETLSNEMKKDLLSLEKEVHIEKKEWPVLRLGWIIMGIFVTGGALGLFGGGLLSGSQKQTSHMLVSYDKLLRYSLNSKIVLSSLKLNTDSSIVINADYPKKIRIEEIMPQPESMKVEGSDIRIKFSSLNSDNIVLYITPVGRGYQRLSLKAGPDQVFIKQFIFF